MDIPAPVFIGGFIALAIVMMVFAYFADKKRTESLGELAEEMGLAFEKNGNHLTSEIQSQFDLFSRGRSRKASNLIYGEANGTGVWIFDYRYTTGGGKNSKTHRQTVACIASAELQLPRFSLYREGLFSRLGSMLGMQDIDFESHPDFSKQYVLKGDNEDAVREVFQENVLSFFEQQDKHLRVEGGGDQLLVYRASRLVKPEMIKDFFAETFGVYREFLPT